MDDCLRRRSAGEHLPDEEVIAANPGLMPELGEELRKLRLIEEAMAPSTVEHVPASADHRAPSRPPPTIPAYELLRMIGSGGFGDVWLARNRLSNSFCALKVVARSHAVELEGVRQYQSLVQTQSNLVPIEHVGETDEVIYYTMPLADDAKGSVDHVRVPSDYEALSLEWCWKHQVTLPFEEILAIAASVLSALRHLHKAGRVHRDVKPGNIMRFNGVWRLGDVGLVASVVDAQVAGGTPAFWPSEGPQGKRADLYALGKTIYLLLTGVDLHCFSEFVSGALRIPYHDPRVPHLRRIILRACHEDARNRYANAEEMQRAITALQNRRPGKYRRYCAAGMAILVVALLIALWRPWTSAGTTTATDTASGINDQPKPVASSFTASLLIKHYRKQDGELVQLGEIGVTASAAIQDDRVVAIADFSEPVHAYLLVINSDGTCDLLIPEPGTEDLETRHFTSPVAATNYWTLDDVGWLAFVVIAAHEPLPAFDGWRSEIVPANWAQALPNGAWEFDGDRCNPLPIRRVGEAQDGPKSLADVCEKLKSRPGVVAVRAVAFPVQKDAKSGE